MSMTFKKFAEGEVSVEFSGAGAPDLNEFMRAAGIDQSPAAPPPAVPSGP